ncbi:MAG: glycosyltransferase family 39 protein [Candidatus Lokiarchaeia archaeon]
MNFVRSETCILALILTLAFILRIYGLEQVPAELYFDEITAVYTPFLYETGLVELSIRSIIAFFLSGTFFTYSLFGPSVFFTRLPGVLLGTLLVLVVYLLAKEMFSKRVGLFSAVLVTLCPWAIHFSRFLAFCSAYVFYFTVAMLFLYKGLNSNNRKMKFAWFCLGSLFLGLTANILASSRIFVPLFIAGFLIINFRAKRFKNNSFFPEVLLYAVIFLLAYFPIFLDYLILDPTTFSTQSGSTFLYAQNIFDLIWLFLERAYLHLSPGFLVFTAPTFHNLGFQETISIVGLLSYSPTFFGMLNYYGVLLYPGVLLLSYQAVKNRSNEHAILLFWIVCYLLVSGIAYYDNPNPARNIVGLPALIITVALVIDFLIKEIRKPQSKVANYKIVLSAVLICLVVVPTGLFLYEYHVTYPVESARAFDYGYKEIAEYLSVNALWEKDIYVHDLWSRNTCLSFYCPQQPPPSNIVEMSDVKMLDPKNSSIQVIKGHAFEQGIIEYEMRMDEGYGDVVSSKVFLVRDENNFLNLAIYANDSTYQPNGYLISQKTHGAYYFEQQHLSEVVEYGEWYTVKLAINSTAISFYFDGIPVTSWLRPADDNYLNIKLAGNSATVSFKNLTIEQNNQSYDLFGQYSLFYWKIIYGKMEIKKDLGGNITVTLLPVCFNSLLVTRYPGDSAAFSEYLSCKLLKLVYGPDGFPALSLFELEPISI